jgi:hypothetical protein
MVGIGSIGDPVKVSIDENDLSLTSTKNISRLNSERYAPVKQKLSHSL